MLSHLSLGEFTFDDDRHALAAGRYVDSLDQHIFLSMFDPFGRKIRGENDLCSRPHAAQANTNIDQRLTRVFVHVRCHLRMWLWSG